MTVNDLISLLQDCDPEAEVRIMMQENWPFECKVQGIAIRDEFASECDCDHRIDEPHEDGCAAEDSDDDALAGTDVFIVEGAQERYGDKAAWSVARR